MATSIDAILRKKREIAETLTSAEVAEILGVSQPRVSVLLKEGRIDGVQQPNGRWKISPDAVAKFQEIPRHHGKHLKK